MSENITMETVEQYLKQVKSVISCKIITDAENNIEEMHIVSNMQRSPKQISRDIQSILISKFGIHIDHKKISIAQIFDESIDQRDFRLKIKGIQYTTAGNKSDIKVVLEKDEENFEGVCAGINSTHNINRMLARAALSAVESFCGLQDIFVLEDVKSASVAGKEVMVVIVTSVLEYSEQELAGSALVTRDKKEAVVKATLDAVNRYIVKLS